MLGYTSVSQTHSLGTKEYRLICRFQGPLVDLMVAFPFQRLLEREDQY